MTVYEFPYDDLMMLPYIKRNKRKKREKDIVRSFNAFDIETTRLADIEQSILYIWAIQFGLDITIYGRTWQEFFYFCEHVKKYMKDRWIVLYVHNLSYEFQFLRGVYAFEPDEVFVTDARRILKCTMFDCIELRCSYMLTNMSLDQFLKKMNVTNQKLSGDIYDYSKIRYPWTPLSEYELQYMTNDVKGLVQALRKMFLSDGDDLNSVPLTSTGYVRRDVKKAMQGYDHRKLKAMLPDPNIYAMLREAFRGGNTMSNRFYTDQIIHDVESYDMVSSYPNVMLTERYPMRPFRPETASVPHLRELLRYPSIALLIRCRFTNIRLIDKDCGYPYIPKDKCRNIMKFTNCNGRILRAGQLDITLTDIDFRIVLSMYEWDAMSVQTLYSSVYRRLPLELRNTILKYYQIKTELKGCDPDTDEYLYYMKNKEKLNSCYGMMVEDPAKDRLTFADNQYIPDNKSLAEMLEEHNRTAFLCYQWGVWVTAWARLNLQKGIEAAGDSFVYCDTDSVKSDRHIDLKKINDDAEQKAQKAGAYAADRYGEVHYMGVYESEGYRLPNRFATMGAKKYVLEDPDGQLHVTIAGVNKKKGGTELERLENFREGFIFRNAGGTESIFNDDVDIWIVREGHELHVTDNVVIKDSTYTLGITAEYRDILDGLVSIRYADHDIAGYYKLRN